MALYAINYDLRQPGRNYKSLKEAIKAYPKWSSPLESSWIVETSWTAVQIRDDLLQHMDGDDALLVTQLSGDAAWSGLSETLTQWLKHAYAA